MHPPGLKPLYAKKGKADESVFPFLCYDRMLTVSDHLVSSWYTGTFFQLSTKPFTPRAAAPEALE